MVQRKKSTNDMDDWVKAASTHGNWKSMAEVYVQKMTFLGVIEEDDDDD